MEIFLEHVGKGFISMLIISMPCVLVAAGIGLVVGILQAVTQVQEQTIAAAPKIVGVFLVLMLMGNVFMTMLTNYFYESVNLAFNVIPQQESFILPPGGRTGTNKPFKDDLNYRNPDIQKIINNPGKAPYVQKLEKSKLIPSNQLPISRPNLMESRKINGR